jgi:hypothetical protein
MAHIESQVYSITNETFTFRNVVAICFYMKNLANLLSCYGMGIQRALTAKDKGESDHHQPPCSKALDKQLTVFQRVKKFPAS